MATHRSWSDEYWLPLMELYLKSPIGVKPLYSRNLVMLSLELHIPPRQIYQQLFKLRSLETPRMEMLWKTYSNKPRKLKNEINRLKEMRGFGRPDEFFDGVEINETFEQDFKPIPADPQLMPMMLIIILDLYFHLTPITMVEETPEVRNLAKLMKIPAKKIVMIMTLFKLCDPFLNRGEVTIHPLLATCGKIWERYGNGNPEQLSALAAQLKDYFQ